jgi:cystathionine beta-synthase
VTVSDKDAMNMARRLTREEGMFVGGSAGLNVFLALDVARQVDDPDACVVTILCDTGERYLSKLFNDEWMQENQLLDIEPLTVAHALARKLNGAPELVSVAPSATVRQALNLMGTYNVSQLPVIDDDRCVGAVSEQVLMAKALANRNLLESAVRECMDGPFPEIDAAAGLDDLIPRLTRETPAVLVREGGALRGVVTRYDVLQQLSGIR